MDSLVYTGFDTRGDFEPLLDEWLTRLKNIPDFKTEIPRSGVPIEGADRIAERIKNRDPYTVVNSPDAEKFYNDFRDYTVNARNFLKQYLPTVDERYTDFEAKTGVDADPRQIDPGIHEFYSHQIPYDLGFAPDYRNFYAGRDPFGQTINLKNTVTPLNENFATYLDNNVSRQIRGKSLNTDTRNVISAANVALLNDHLNKPGILMSSSRELLPTRLGLQYPEYLTKANFSSDYPGTVSSNFIQKANDIGDLVNSKYVEPAAAQLEGAIRTQLPGLIDDKQVSEYGMPSSFRYISALQNLERQYRGSRQPLFNETQFLMSADPVTAAVKGIPEAARAIKRTPASLLPGAADLIPSPEAIRTGYAKGPIEMGKQMASEFVQSLPAAAASAGILSTPIAAPFAPGIGAGLVGAAAARAANEVVRQETGEGIVPKVRQFIGTAPRTGVAAKPTSANQPLTAEIRPLSAKEKTNMINRENRNELQRRIDLAGERFNPRRGEFGLSELLLGR